MMNKIATVKTLCVILSVLVLDACSDSNSQRVTVVTNRNGSYSYIAPYGWNEFGGDNAPSRLYGSVHYGRDRNGGNETFSINVIKDLATDDYIENLKIRADTITRSGNYTYYEYGWRSENGDSVQYSRIVNYDERWFGIGYSAEKLDVKTGRTLDETQLPAEIKKSIISFKVLEDPGPVSGDPETVSDTVLTDDSD